MEKCDLIVVLINHVVDDYIILYTYITLCRFNPIERYIIIVVF